MFHILLQRCYFIIDDGSGKLNKFLPNDESLLCLVGRWRGEKAIP